MVGGPNEDKHEIDYEFSQYSRDGLIYEFADATDEDILTVGGDEYIKTREERKKRIADGESLNGTEILPGKEENVSVTASSAPAPSLDKPDFTVVNEIEDRVTRATAKKAFTQKFKEKASFQEISKFVKLSLEENGKYSSNLDDIIKRISEMKVPQSTDAESSESTPAQEEMTHKSFNDLENKMQRGIVKKLFIGEKKKGLSDLDILKLIRAELKTKEMLDDQAKELLKKLMLQSVKPKETPKVESDVFDLKKLNDIEDKMTRGLAKKVYTKSKRDGKKSTEILADIESELQSQEKLTGSVDAVITGIRESI